MKRSFISILAVAGILISGCALEEVPSSEGSIRAIMENDETRTSVTDEGKFTWSADDQIWLGTTSGSVIGTLSTGAGTANATFSYDSFFGEMTGKAVYPYNFGHSVKGDVLDMVLPASYDLGTSLQNTNAALYGVNVDGTLKFNHLAGVMRFKFKNVPAGVNQFVITLDKKINGTFEADLTKDYPVLETSSTEVESEKTVTFNFDALTQTSDIMIYVPLPLGTYNSLGLALNNAEESVWTYSNTVTNTIKRKKLILMPTVTLSGSIDGDLEGENNSILYYASYDNEAVTPKKDFNVGILSNTYDASLNSRNEGCITFNGTISSIPDACFTYIDATDKKLTYVTIPEGVVSIGSGAFAFNIIADVDFPSSLKEIKNGAFENCDLSERENLFSFNEGLTEIGYEAFKTSNTESSSSVITDKNTVIFPASLTSIGESILSGRDVAKVVINCKSFDMKSLYGISNVSNLKVESNAESLTYTPSKDIDGIQSLTLGANTKEVDVRWLIKTIPGFGNGGVIINALTPPTILNNGNLSNPPYEQIRVIVPSESLATYKNTSPWSYCQLSAN